MTAASDGLVLIDKPAGPTSHDVVAMVRRALGGIRVGHTGTLDPPATGLLAIVLGRATRLARYLPREPKTYVGRFVLGVTTATDDLTGTVLRRHDGPLPDDLSVVAAARALEGSQLQVPPSVSAKRVAGRRLYAFARRGELVTAPAVEVHVDRFDVRRGTEPSSWEYELVVTAGTYVRACIRDLGARLGCGAAVASLRRTAIGPWSVENALTCPDDPSAWRPALTARVIELDAMPLTVDPVRLSDGAAQRLFASGGSIRCPAPELSAGTEVAVHAASGGLLGIGELVNGLVHPRVVVIDR